MSGDIIAAGSSTVYPLAERMAERFVDDGYAGNITIDSIGTGGGFERFCKAGETDIANASRADQGREIESCAAIGRTPVEFRVGTDALAVVVNPANDWVGPEGVTVEEWRSSSRPSDQLVGREPGLAGGADQALQPWHGQRHLRLLHRGGDEPGLRTPADAGKGEEALLNAANLQLSEDDNVLVQGVAGDKNAIGYFGFAYFEENADKLRDLAIEGVAPSAETVNAGEYPLARPLFIYSDAAVMTSKPQVADFINFFLTNVDEEVLQRRLLPGCPGSARPGQAELAPGHGDGSCRR